jgi:hypothetical protein
MAALNNLSMRTAPYCIILTIHQSYLADVGAPMQAPDTIVVSTPMKPCHLASLEPEDKLAMLEEFKVLREEILKRFELRSRIVEITLVATGAVWTAALQSEDIARVLFVYPVLVVLLASIWASQGRTIRTIGRHIREEIEPCQPGLQWETKTRARRKNVPHQSRARMLSEGGLFLAIQFVTISLGIYITMKESLDWRIIVVEAALLLGTFEIVRRYWIAYLAADK